MGDVDSLGEAHVALAEGRWSDARAGFEQVIANDASGDACFGLAVASWWLGDNRSSVDHCGQAYSLFRRSADVERAAQCAVWLAIAYKANFANYSAANGWIARAERLLEPLEPGTLHGWVWVARAYRNPDLARGGGADRARRSTPRGRRGMSISSSSPCRSSGWCASPRVRPTPGSR